MSESSNPLNVLAAINGAEANSRPQQNIIDGQSSFTELKESCQTHTECQQFKQIEQYMNQGGTTSREDLISITETLNGHVTSLRSAETLLMQEEKDSEKLDECEKVQIKADKGEDQSNKEWMKMDNIEQKIKNAQTPPDGISLTQTTPFQILQDKNVDIEKPADLNNEQHQRTFTLAHTQQITIEQGACKQRVYLVAEALKNAFIQRKSKLSIAKTLDEKHNPRQTQNKQEQAKNNQDTAPQVSNKEAKAQTSQIKQENTPKSQPFKLQNLYVSSLRSNSVIKPPQSASEKKPKIWQMFKSKRQIKEPAPSNSPKQGQMVKSLTQKVLEKSISNTDAVNNNTIVQDIIKTNPPKQDVIKPSPANQDVIKPNLPIQVVKQQVSQPIQQSLKLEEAKQATTQNVPQTPKIEQKKDNKPLFDEKDVKIEPDVIQFHQTRHHPLDKPFLQQKQKPQLLSKISIQPIQQPSLTSVLDNTELKRQKQQQQQIKLLAKQGQKQQEIQVKMEAQQSSASPSQRQEMIVDYTHNKDYQLQLQKMNRQKIKQLEQKLKNQEQLNKELQKSLSFPTKFLTSAAVGVSTAGIAWIAKKNRNLSILIGFATTLASLVLSD